jgi:hypothetical protein
MASPFTPTTHTRSGLDGLEAGRLIKVRYEHTGL